MSIALSVLDPVHKEQCETPRGQRHGFRIWRPDGGADSSSGPLQHMAIAAGKDGRLFIMDRDNLGDFHTPDVPKNVPIDHCLCEPSYFEGPDGQPRIELCVLRPILRW
jgi:hypothetical protein